MKIPVESAFADLKLLTDLSLVCSFTEKRSSLFRISLGLGSETFGTASDSSSSPSSVQGRP